MMSTGIPVLEILKGGSDDPLSTVKLDRESRKYIHVRAKNIINMYFIEGDEKGQSGNVYA